MNDSDFYIGYLPKAPKKLRKRMALTVAFLLALAVGVAAVLVFMQAPFAPSVFEFQQYRDFTGAIEEFPYPSLVTASGGTDLTRRLLVAPGKHGAADLVRTLDGRSVRLTGSLIRRPEQMMIEVVPGSVAETANVTAARPVSINLGHAVLRGEIADTKCYFGVMNPGSGKVHRDCAVRCISGGIPPSFLVRDSAGSVKALLLTGPGGGPLRSEVLAFVAEPVEISGELIRSANTLVFRADSLAFRRVSDRE
jgi:hypothetical protein